MPYLTKSGRVLEEPAKSRKIGTSILTYGLVIGIGVGLCLVLAANPRIIAGIQSISKDIGMAIWNMLCNAAHACAEFVHYLVNTRSG